MPNDYHSRNIETVVVVDRIINLRLALNALKKVL